MRILLILIFIVSLSCKEKTEVCGVKKTVSIYVDEKSKEINDYLFSTNNLPPREIMPVIEFFNSKKEFDAINNIRLYVDSTLDDNAYHFKYESVDYLVLSKSYVASLKEAGGRDFSVENYFLIGHELGHFLLKHTLVGDKKTELQADSVAAILLSGKFGVGDVNELAKIFDYTSINGYPSRQERYSVIKRVFDLNEINPSIKDKQIYAAKFEREYPMIEIYGSPEFLMGSSVTFNSQTYDKFKVDNEKPQKKLTVKDFQIGKNEITQDVYYSITRKVPSNHENCKKCPVENVSYEDVYEFINTLNKKTGKEYKLPTEIQWEYAAQFGMSEKEIINFHKDSLETKGWIFSNSNFQTQQIGKKRHNKNIDLYDMIGNVSEWCSDSWSNKYNETRVNREIGVLRGGNISNSNDLYYRIRARTQHPKSNGYQAGFRLVRD